MSPVLNREDGYVFKIYSNEEPRIHVHVLKAENEAKFWLEPDIELDTNFGFSSKELSIIKKLIEKHGDDFKKGYIAHVGKRSDD